MPKPEFTAADFVDPEAPEEELQLRPDHPLVRDLSYERSRGRQLTDLYKGSLYHPGWETEDPESDGLPPSERVEVFLKERPRGKGYVADLLYSSADLPFVVYGILVHDGRRLGIAELEIFSLDWGYFDPWGDFVGEASMVADDGENQSAEPAVITSDALRRIPLGRIMAMAQQVLASDEWRDKGVTVLMGADRGPSELTDSEVAALELGNSAAAETRRGRPPLDEALLIEVARAYLEEATGGPGLLRRLAVRFDRPEATVRDWVAAARRDGFLTPAVKGRRGAGAGPNLPAQEACTTTDIP